MGRRAARARDGPGLRRRLAAPGRGQQLASGVLPDGSGRVAPRGAARSCGAGEADDGEVVATVSNDAMRAGGAFDITARLAGAIASYFVVAAILLSTSFVLGLVVLLGVPVLVTSLSFVIRPLQARQREQREEVGRLTALGADTVSGLRVLRGIGGEQVFSLATGAAPSRCAARAFASPCRSPRSIRRRCCCPASSSSSSRGSEPGSRSRAASVPASSSPSTATQPSSSSRFVRPPRPSTRSRAPMSGRTGCWRS